MNTITVYIYMVGCSLREAIHRDWFPNEARAKSEAEFLTETDQRDYNVYKVEARI